MGCVETKCSRVAQVTQKMSRTSLRHLRIAAFLRPSAIRRISSSATTAPVSLLGKSTRAGLAAAALVSAYVLYSSTATVSLDPTKDNSPTLSGREDSLDIDGVNVPIVSEFPGQDPGDTSRPRLVILGSGLLFIYHCH
ncbi:hypothetical protein HK096_007890 [Nowakowskiella sp. JEL0078]|nr:hypothetical protein HK096_007890 [Nowakowskiella sp. JEL0078]